MEEKLKLDKVMFLFFFLFLRSSTSVPVSVFLTLRQSPFLLFTIIFYTFQYPFVLAPGLVFSQHFTKLPSNIRYPFAF